MTAYLVILVIILFGVAVWQINKVFKLLQPAKSEDSEVASDKDNNTQGYMMLGFVFFIYWILAYCFWKWGNVLLPVAASEHGLEIDQLMLVTMVLIFVVGIFTQWLLHYFAFVYRGSKDKKALFYADNDRLEMIWTIIPVITLAGLILYGLYTWTDIMTVEENDEALVVELYAQQFNWKARYAGEDGVLGDANVRFLQDFDGKNLVGIDATDPNGFDDVVVQELHLPVGREVIFKMRSQDVLHSAFMPHFRAQMNCVPGMITEFAYTPKTTTEAMRQNPEMVAKVKKINKIRVEKSKDLVANGDTALDPYEFDYLLLCNKVCGASHYNMQMKIIVESQKEYNQWMEQQQTFAEFIQ